MGPNLVPLPVFPLPQFLRTRSKEFFSVREISRFVGCEFAVNDSNWAAPFLKHLLQKELIESDCLNHYRFKRRNMNT